MAGELARELARFPFHKLMPDSFRLEIASLTPKELDVRQVRTWVQTHDIPKLLKAVGSSKVLRSFPHLDFVFLELSGSQLAALDEIDVVTAAWNDENLHSGTSVVDRSNQSPRPVAVGTHR